MENPNLTSTPSPKPSNEEIIKDILGKFSVSPKTLHGLYHADKDILGGVGGINENSTIVDTIIALVGKIERLKTNSTTNQQEEELIYSESGENFHNTNKSTILILNQMIEKIRKIYNIPKNINKTGQMGTSVGDIIHSTSDINEMMNLIEKLIPHIIAESELLSPVVEKSAAIVAETLEQGKKYEAFPGFVVETPEEGPASGEFVWISVPDSGGKTTLPTIYQNLLKLVLYKLEQGKKRPELEQKTRGESQIKHRNRTTFSKGTHAIQLPTTHQEEHEKKFLTHHKDTETNKSHYILSTLDTKSGEDDDERQGIFFAFAANHEKKGIPKQEAGTPHEEQGLTHQYFSSIGELREYLIAILHEADETNGEPDSSYIIL